MPRTYSKNGTKVVSTPKGSYTTKQTSSGPKHTFTGSGPAPAGATKVAEPSYSEVPTVTVTSSGKVTTSGYSSQKAASAARKRARASKQRARAILRPVKTAPQKAAQRAAPKLATYTPPKAKTVAYKPPPSPKSKPQKFKGKPTAGTPTLKELQTGSKSNTLKVNQKGFVTTAPVRKAARTVKKLQAKARKSNAPLPGLDREQTKVARTVLKVGTKAKASKKEKLAAVETGLVESSLRNLNYGDADSLGWRQERTSQYGVGPAMNVKGGAKRFYQESISDTGGTRGAGQTAGELAQTIQGSAYPERYDERKPEAAAILHAYNKGGLKPAEQKKLAKATAKAEKLGLSVGRSTKVGPAPKKVVTRFKAAKKAMKEVEGLPYVWGGGHGSPTSSPTGGGLDCSGAVGYVLNKIHALKGSLTSGDMGSVLKPGPGALTVFYNGEHTFLRLGNEYWGTSVGDSGAGGLGPHPAPSASYLASYNVGHVPGLGRKQALELGFKNLGSASSQAFPGMTLSSSGTTATINPGAGATVGKPGFSNKPIKLTATQKAKRKLHKLDELQVGAGRPTTAETTTASAPSTSELARLERKYSVAA